MFVSLVFVKCLSDETYIFLADVDIQWKLPTTEENAKIQLEAISKMCSFWVCRRWIKPKQRQQQLSALLAGLKEKTSDWLEGEASRIKWSVLLWVINERLTQPWLYFFCSERRCMYFNYFTQTDARQAQVYGVLVCNLICSTFHRFSRQEKDRLSCSALSNEDFCRENNDINLLVSSYRVGGSGAVL